MCCAWRVARPIDSLPDDVDALRTLALNAIAERDAAIAERDRLIELNDRLRRLLRKAQGFEAKSERLAKLHPDRRGRRLPLHRGNGGSTAAHCPPICRAFTRRSRRPTRTARAARSRCM